MKIMHIEDRSIAASIGDTLKRKGYEVEWVENLADAEYYLTEDPGYAAYDALILDLNMSPIDLPPKLAAIAQKEHLFAGWLFYKYVLTEESRLRERTILFSGFMDELKHRISAEEYAKLRIVNKSDWLHDKKIIEHLEDIKLMIEAERQA